MKNSISTSLLSSTLWSSSHLIAVCGFKPNFAIYLHRVPPYRPSCFIPERVNTSSTMGWEPKFCGAARCVAKIVAIKPAVVVSVAVAAAISAKKQPAHGKANPTAWHIPLRKPVSPQGKPTSIKCAPIGMVCQRHDAILLLFYFSVFCENFAVSALE